MQKDTIGPGPKHVLVGALLGAAIGAGLGFTAAYVSIQHGDYLDHSEDGLTYFYSSLVGGLVGLFIGTFAGYLYR